MHCPRGYWCQREEMLFSVYLHIDILICCTQGPASVPRGERTRGNNPAPLWTWTNCERVYHHVLICLCSKCSEKERRLFCLYFIIRVTWVNNKHAEAKFSVSFQSGLWQGDKQDSRMVTEADRISWQLLLSEYQFFSYRNDKKGNSIQIFL